MSVFERYLEEAARGGNMRAADKGSPRAPYAKEMRMELRRATSSIKDAHKMLDRHVKDMEDDGGYDKKHHVHLLRAAHLLVSNATHHCDRHDELSDMGDEHHCDRSDCQKVEKRHAEAARNFAAKFKMKPSKL